MDKQQQTTYLANIYYVLKADGGVDRIEEDAFEEIRRDIGAGYFEKQEAMELADKDGYQLEPVGRWSERIRNLEDMLYAAYCNGVFEKAEKKVVKEFAGRLGIDQRQFDVVRQETRQRYAARKERTG